LICIFNFLVINALIIKVIRFFLFHKNDYYHCFKKTAMEQIKTNNLKTHPGLENASCIQSYFKSVFRKLKYTVVTGIIFFIATFNVSAVSKNTNTSGNWGTGSNWTPAGVPLASDDATVNNAMTINTNIAINLLSSYYINAPSIDLAGGTAHTVTVSGLLDVAANMTIEGALTVNATGQLIVRNGATLTVGSAAFVALSSITIEQGGTLIVNGTMDVYTGMTVHGDIIVNGNYTGYLLTAVIGTGTIRSTGSIVTVLGSIYGDATDCNTGPCIKTSCANVATATASGLSVCAGSSSTLTASLSVSGGTITYQWQSSLTSMGGYSNISGATNSTYVASPVSLRYYRVRITRSGCTATSSGIGISVQSLPTITSTTPATVCQGAAITLGAAASAGTLSWFNTPVSGTSLATGPTYSPVISTTTNYYVEATNAGCKSAARTMVTATVNPLPSITLGAYPTICSGATSASVTYTSPVNSPDQYSINWSNAANAAGIADVGLTMLSGGVIPLNGLVSALGTYGAAITVRNSTTGCQNVVATNPICNNVVQNTMNTITAPSNGTFTSVKFASYGTPVGTCGNYTVGACHAANSLSLIQAAAIGVNSFSIQASNGIFGDPCSGTPKNLAIEMLYSDFTLTVNTCTNIWNGASSIDWNTPSNWSLGTIPIQTNNTAIPSSVASGRMPTVSGNAETKSLTNNGIITFTSGGILNTYGDIVNNGTFTTVSGSKVSFNGSSAQTVTGVPVLHNVEVNNTSSGGVSLSSALALNGTLSLKNGVLTTNSNLTVYFDNGGNIAYASSDAGSISGNVSGRRALIIRTHYIASSFSGSTSAEVQATTPLYHNSNWRLFTKDFAAQNWVAVTNTTTSMPLGTGFSLTLAAPAPLILSGTYNHAFTYNSALYSNVLANKYILVGNPYPSTLDWNNAAGWTKTNISDAIYYWDPANNRVASYVNGAGANGGTQYIPAMQSFHVTTTGSGGTSSVSINNNARLSTFISPYFRAAEDDVVRVHLTSCADTRRSDETVIRFNEYATNDFDYDLDAHKILNTGDMPSVYTATKGNIYSINSYVSVDSAKYIPLATKLASDGSYTLKVSGTNPDIDYILVDKLLGTSRSIDNDSCYAFNGLKSDDANRFELQLRISEITVSTGVQSANKNRGLGIFSSSKGFVIKTDRYAGEKADIEILDMTGNSIQLLTGMNLSTGSTYVPLDLADGAYLIKVHVNDTAFAGMIALIK
jgi:formylmethanofuran dehydrogenase subunit C